jgi:hypothetical protein
MSEQSGQSGQSGQSEAEIFYRELVGIFNSGPDKLENELVILEQLATKFRNADERTIYEIKVLMETQFMRDVKCNYMYLLTPTPEKHGCDIRELIYNIAPEELRSQILQEIAVRPNEERLPHILTDIDDTLFASFNPFVETSGSDRSWTSKKPYPGVKLLYRMFHNNIPLPAARYSTILTGTPLFLKENRMSNTLLKEILGNNFGFMHGFDKKRHALYALLKGLYERPFYKLAVSSTEVAAVKFNKYKQYISIFPEYDILFIGDNGQGDLLAGKMMIKHHKNTLVFIHNLLRDDDFIFSPEKEEQEKRGTNGRLFFFKNYLELGYIFSTLGFIKKSDYAELRIAIAKEIKENIPTNCNLNDIKTCNERHKFSHYLCPNPAFPEYVCLTTASLRQRAGTRRHQRNIRKTRRR